MKTKYILLAQIVSTREVDHDREEKETQIRTTKSILLKL